MTTNWATEITSRVPIKEGLEYYGVHFNSRGYACCPFHGEKTASFRILPGKQKAKCFGCGAYVSLIDYVMMTYSLDFKQACVKIDSDFCLGLVGRKPSLAEQRKAAIRRQQIERNKKLKKAYEVGLLNLIDGRRNLWSWAIRCPELPELMDKVKEMDEQIDLKLEILDRWHTA